MFNKRRKRKESDNVKEELDLEIKEDYRKKEYNTDNLVIANLVVDASNMIFIGTTDHRYIFENITEEGKEKYREIFTGFVAEKAPFHYDYEEVKEKKKNLSFMKEKDTINRKVSTTGFSSK